MELPSLNFRHERKLSLRLQNLKPQSLSRINQLTSTECLSSPKTSVMSSGARFMKTRNFLFTQVSEQSSIPNLSKVTSPAVLTALPKIKQCTFGRKQSLLEQSEFTEMKSCLEGIGLSESNAIPDSYLHQSELVGKTWRAKRAKQTHLEKAPTSKEAILLRNFFS